MDTDKCLNPLSSENAFETLCSRIQEQEAREGDLGLEHVDKLLTDTYTAKKPGTLGFQEGTRLTRNHCIESRVTWSENLEPAWDSEDRSSPGLSENLSTTIVWETQTPGRQRRDLWRESENIRRRVVQPGRESQCFP